MNLFITILPVVTKYLSISPPFTPYEFLSRCKFSTLTTRQPMVEFYLLPFPRFPLRKKEHKSNFSKNRTHDFRTSRCAGYLLDHSGDEGLDLVGNPLKSFIFTFFSRIMRLILPFFAQLLSSYIILVIQHYIHMQSPNVSKIGALQPLEEIEIRRPSK